MRIALDYTNASAATNAHTSLLRVAKLLEQEQIDLTLNIVRNAHTNTLYLNLWRNEDAVSELVEISHQHDDGSRDRDAGDTARDDEVKLTTVPATVRPASGTVNDVITNSLVTDVPQGRHPEEFGYALKGTGPVADITYLPNGYPAEKRDPETFSVNDMLGDNPDAGSLREAFADAAVQQLQADEVAREHLDDDGAPAPEKAEF